MSTYPQAIYDRTASCAGCLFAQKYDGESLTCHVEPPPRDSAFQQPGSKALWPIVDPDAWCGRFLPDKVDA